MSSHTTWTALPGHGEALVVRPTDPPHGVVLVYGELFGTTALVTDALERLAAAGYLALAPDTYWQHHPRAAFTYDDHGRSDAFQALAQLSTGALVDQARAALDSTPPLARRHLLGFSSGGNIALQLATHLTVNSTTAVYPGWLLHATGPLPAPAPLERAAHLDGPVTIIAGAADTLVAPDLDAIDETLTRHAIQHQIHTLPGVPHGYACHDRAGYDTIATSTTWNTILDTIRNAS